MLELQTLQLQIQNLKILLNDAILSDKPIEQINKLYDQIKAIEKLINHHNASPGNNENPD